MLNLLPGVQSTTAALTAERTRLDVIAQNIANANTTRGLDGKPYRRQQVVFESVLERARQSNSVEPQMSGPRVSRIERDSSPSRMVPMLGHPDADPVTGLVQMPNVDIHTEMADLIAASRTFDANLAVLKTAKQMTMQALSIGKR
jgi:flagellar basal-body rod protein FlgC